MIPFEDSKHVLTAGDRRATARPQEGGVTGDPEHGRLQSIQKLEGVRILATAWEGEVGSVKNVYFDDEQWVVRYLVVDTGGWLGGRRVLISPNAVQSIDWPHRAIVLNLTRDQVEGGPGIDTDKPVSRQQEAAYHRYCGYPEYWQSGAFWASGSALPLIEPADPLRLEEEEARRGAQARREGLDAHLRSSEEVIGYCIEASDASIGHVANFLFEEGTWVIRYLIVDTRHWLPGKHVLISPLWIREVSWSDRTLSLDLTRRQIEQSPEHDAQHAPSPEYERWLHRHYARSHYRQ